MYHYYICTSTLKDFYMAINFNLFNFYKINIYKIAVVFFQIIQAESASLNVVKLDIKMTTGLEDCLKVLAFEHEKVSSQGESTTFC